MQRRPAHFLQHHQPHNAQCRAPAHCSTGLWVGDCLIYNNAAWRLNYCVGGEVTTLFHLDKPLYLLGYLAAQSKVYLIDRLVAGTSHLPMHACMHTHTRKRVRISVRLLV